jgi:hypothetical protein
MMGTEKSGLFFKINYGIGIWKGWRRNVERMNYGEYEKDRV